MTLAAVTTTTSILEGFKLIDSCRFKINRLDQALELSYFAAEMFDDPRRTQPGLLALLENAVEYGCLGVGYDLKTTLLAGNLWQSEILRRQSLPENRQKSVDIVIARRDGGTAVVISDPGPGFNWRPWLALDPARAGDNHGRGIALARNLSFDTLSYNDSGNKMTAYAKNSIDIKW